VCDRARELAVADWVSANWLMINGCWSSRLIVRGWSFRVRTKWLPLEVREGCGGPT